MMKSNSSNGTYFLLIFQGTEIRTILWKILWLSGMIRLQSSPRFSTWWGAQGVKNITAAILTFLTDPSLPLPGHLAVNSLTGQDTSAQMPDHNKSYMILTLSNYKPGNYGRNSLLILSASFFYCRSKEDSLPAFCAERKRFYKKNREGSCPNFIISC